MAEFKYQSTKIFDNFSIALRQWKAQHSHCQLLHGYAFEFKVWFESNEEDIDKQLDDMNWIVDFGGFKDADNESGSGGNGLKSWMNHMFDHTTLIEKDDPHKDMFEVLQDYKVAKVHFLDKMGAESIARLVFEKMDEVMSKTDGARCRVFKVECMENNKNSGIYTRC